MQMADDRPLMAFFMPNHVNVVIKQLNNPFTEFENSVSPLSLHSKHAHWNT